MTHLKIERVCFQTPQIYPSKPEENQNVPPAGFFEALQKRSPALSALPIARLKEALMKEVRKMFSGNLPAGQNEKSRIDVVLSKEIILAETPKGVPTGGSGGCFTADSLLLLRNGETVRFDDLAAGIAVKGELPELASWDIEKRKVVFQKPLALVEHLFEEPQEVLRLNNIEVTPEHPILALRKRKTIFLAAGKLQREDLLISPFGYRYRGIRKEKRETEVPVQNLYNLSFDSQKGKQFPYFLVSHNGMGWVIAHNMKSHTG